MHYENTVNSVGKVELQKVHCTFLKWKKETVFHDSKFSLDGFDRGNR